MKIVLLVAGCLLVLLLALVLLPKVVLRAIEPGLEARIARDWPADQVLSKDLTANFFGLQSKGAGQMRGNGALVLTARELRFYQVAPEQELRINLDDIERTSTVRSHLGKTIGVDLLWVSFSVAGRADSVAWYVADPAAWQQLIAATTERMRASAMLTGNRTPR
ncbi:MAG: hypothetical protein ABIP94_22820, partial [Planctomycetota bacterium]